MGISNEPRENFENSKYVKEDKEKHIIWPQVLAILVGCLASTNDGLLFAWTSPFIVKLTNDKENYNISEEEASYLTIIPSMGLIFFSAIFSKLSDVFGRKRTLMLITIPHIMGWVMTLVGNHIYFFYVSRLFSGLGDTILFTCLPVYVGEIASPEVRGVLGSAVTYFVFYGQFLINLIGFFFNVRDTAYICITLPLIFLVLFSFMPESPYYFIMKGRENDAKHSLRKLKCKIDIEKDYCKLKADVERQMSERGTWKEIVTIRSNRKAFIAASLLRISQQLSGIPVFCTNTQLVFEKAGGNIDSGISSMIYMGLSAITIMVAGFVIDKIGRRIALISSLLSCSVMLFIESLYFYIDQNVPEIDVAFVNWLPLVGMLLFLLFSSFGLVLIPTLMLGEIFSASIKAKALTLQLIIFGIMVSATNYLFYLINSYTGLYGPFAFFGICNIISATLSYYYIPETKGKSLEEIQQMLRR